MTSKIYGTGRVFMDPSGSPIGPIFYKVSKEEMSSFLLGRNIEDYFRPGKRLSVTLRQDMDTFLGRDTKRGLCEG